MTSAPSPLSQPSMRDRLAYLDFADACRLLGNDGKRLLIRGGGLESIPADALRIDEKEARLVAADAASTRTLARIYFHPARRGRLCAECSFCAEPCEHVGALLSMLLEQKMDLGLAAPPPETLPAEDEAALVAQAIAERMARAKAERMTITSADAKSPWTDYEVRSALSGKTYRVALRGDERGISYCSCPDFKVNTLGTCKHIMKVLARARTAFSAKVRRQAYVRRRITIHVRYGEGVALALALPQALAPDARSIIAPLLDRPISLDEVKDLLARLRDLERGAHAFFVTPDAEELIERKLLALRTERLVSEIRKDPADHPLRTTLLEEPLLPYQLDGIAFAAGAGRAILADEMGLGKTIQGVGVAELLARESGITKVLIVCPASLKSQWRSEIHRFSRREVDVVLGSAKDRGRAYEGNSFFTICNYEQVLKDILFIEKTRWDLIILDEGQRIKNWQAKTSRVVKGLASRFALVLTGTPLENRLDDLHSVVAFVDPHRLGPAFRFLHRHERRDKDGKLLGFKNLGDVRARIAPVLLRRTRESVRLELPPRTIEIVRIRPSAEQKERHDASMREVARIVRKKYLTEMDLLRLRAALLNCRMAANSTFLVDKEAPGYSTKLERLAEIFDEIAETPDAKVVLFSEWTTMLDLIEPLLEERALGCVRLDGSVPQKKRQALVMRFRSDPAARVFLTTNAGSTGLNLQAANVVINVDVPWNPAVLEQRIARAHRMGQERPVHVHVLVTEDTLEENLLGTLSTKRDLALAALDPESTVASVDVLSQGDDLKKRLEVLLGTKPDAPIHEAERAAVGEAVAEERMAHSNGNFVRSAVELLGELVGREDAEAREGIVRELSSTLDMKIARDEAGEERVSFALPSREKLATIFETFARLLAHRS